jgi:hypothetical protein
MISLCCERGALSARDCSLFDPRSLNDCNIGARGAQHTGEALQSNKALALTTLECVPASLSPPKSNMLALLLAGNADVMTLFGPHSLGRNKIGDEGAWHIGEALKINTALTALWCVLLPCTIAKGACNAVVSARGR